MYGKGCSYEGELINLGVQHNLIEKAGSWYSYKGNKIGQGKENVKAYLQANPKAVAEIDDKIRKLCLPQKDKNLENSMKGQSKEAKNLINTSV